MCLRALNANEKKGFEGRDRERGVGRVTLPVQAHVFTVLLGQVVQWAPLMFADWEPTPVRTCL